MRVLVTNDDGVWAPGLAVLARALCDHGLDVVVAAPLDDRSGSSAAIGPGYAAEGDVDPHFDTAAVFGVWAYDWLIGTPVGTVLNVNVPNVRMGEVRGVRSAAATVRHGTHGVGRVGGRASPAGAAGDGSRVGARHRHRAGHGGLRRRHPARRRAGD